MYTDYLSAVVFIVLVLDIAFMASVQDLSLTRKKERDRENQLLTQIELLSLVTLDFDGLL